MVVGGYSFLRRLDETVREILFMDSQSSEAQKIELVRTDAREVIRSTGAAWASQEAAREAKCPTSEDDPRTAGKLPVLGRHLGT